MITYAIVIGLILLLFGSFLVGLFYSKRTRKLIIFTLVFMIVIIAIALFLRLVVFPIKAV
jgi:hypothetical protein